MYRNYGNFRGGSDQMREADSSSAPVDSPDTSAQQQQQKFSLGGAAQFIPSLNAIASSQDLQWLVQPSLWPQPGPSAPPLPLFPPPSTLRCSPPPHLHHSGLPSGGAVAMTTRRRPDEHLSPEELERKRVRRERNKMAAAKCRNRRRVLTDTLQNETDLLESDKSGLQKEIAGLEKQKEKLELVLEAHRPICKIQSSDSDSDRAEPAGGRSIKAEPGGETGGPSCRKRLAKLRMSLPPAPPPRSPPEPESLHTPTLISTPSLTPFTASLVFTYPSAPQDSQPLPPPSSSSSSTAHSLQKAQPCGVAHRRSSSSGDQSDHSLNSPTLLTL